VLLTGGMIWERVRVTSMTRERDEEVAEHSGDNEMTKAMRKQ